MTAIHESLADVREGRTHATHQWTLADLTAYRAPDGRVLLMIGLGPLTFHTSTGQTVGEAAHALYAHLGLTPPPVTLPPHRPPSGTQLRVTEQADAYVARAVYPNGRRSPPTRGESPLHALSFLLHALKETTR